jgi:hypothetical protein
VITPLPVRSFPRHRRPQSWIADGAFKLHGECASCVADITSNTRGLFNGDVGIALDGVDGLRVWFELSDREGNAGLRSFSPRALPAHESAWAITIHRSQGSEYRDVAVVLPPDEDNRILTRELVYTAISRARDHAEIWTADATARRAGPAYPAPGWFARMPDSSTDITPSSSPPLRPKEVP